MNNFWMKTTVIKLQNTKSGKKTGFLIETFEGETFTCEEVCEKVIEEWLKENPHEHRDDLKVIAVEEYENEVEASESLSRFLGEKPISRH